jgi:hypothetical protein
MLANSAFSPIVLSKVVAPLPTAPTPLLVCLVAYTHGFRRFGHIKLAQLRPFYLKCLYQARKASGHGEGNKLYAKIKVSCGLSIYM